MLKLGVLGSSDGNGHPYSWSAIFNGYDAEWMASCPYPAIPDYLSKRSFPEDGLGHLGRVTHVWTQERHLSEHIARASRIDHIVAEPREMIGKVDAILLARDDAANHFRLAAPFLKAGLPVYVDKPVAFRKRDLDALLREQTWEGQLFTCTALRYAPELRLSDEQLAASGRVLSIEGLTPKYWETYGVHIVEPALALLRRAGQPFASFSDVRVARVAERHVVDARVDDCSLRMSACGKEQVPLRLTVTFEGGRFELTFADAFTAFRAALEAFVRSIRGPLPIPREETLAVVNLLELGLG